jgi:hypothetical protein
MRSIDILTGCKSLDQLEQSHSSTPLPHITKEWHQVEKEKRTVPEKNSSFVTGFLFLHLKACE